MIPRIVHLGPGAFARAFLIPWVEEAGGWSVTGVSLKSATVRDPLAGQGYDYTALEMPPEGVRPRRVTALERILVAPEDPGAVLALMADPATRIVSLTITEKGYCLDPATGRLQADHPDIAHDIVSALPRSAPGFLVRALEARWRAGVPPFTVLSCDNLPETGRRTARAVTDLAARIDPGLARWIAAEVAFPSTMVDRIVPATTPEDLALAEALTGWPDKAPVKHEPFRQWVIEDRFPTGLPALEQVGVQMVADVAPFEAMKLRMLNGTHSALAYLGYLAGHKLIVEAEADPALAGFVRHLWRAEVIPSLTPPPGMSLPDYAEALMARYANPAIRHATWQIAMDGSQKLPQRILATLADGLTAGRTVDGLLLVVAAWMRYVGGVDETGAPIDVRDPLAARLRALSEAGGDVTGAILGVTEVFDPALAARIAAPLAGMYDQLCTDGARAMAARFAA